MEKMKTLTIGGVTYAVCAPLTQEEKQEVTQRVLDSISYEDILQPHKAEIAAQAAVDAQAAMELTQKTLTEADFAIGGVKTSGSAIGDFNPSTNSFATTPDLLECTAENPYSVTVNGDSRLGIYYYANGEYIGVADTGGELKEDIQDVCDFVWFNKNTTLTERKADITHIRISINYHADKTTVTKDNLADVVGEFTFTRKYRDPCIRQSELDTFGKKLNVRENPLKVIFLGDSITAGSYGPSWTTYFLEKINGEEVANVAVGGANLKDMEGTVYDGAPEAANNTNNVLGNQVQKILQEDYEAPDIILIAIGTNDGIVIAQEDMDTAYSVPLENVDRKTAAGAFRYASEMLHNQYPNATIFWCSPIHSAKVNRKPSEIRKWHESLRIATEYTGLQHIDTLHCGITSAYEVDGATGEYLKDGLHPNTQGAKKIGYYNAGKVNAVMF